MIAKYNIQSWKKSDKINEEWRSTKKLGSLMDDQGDILRRKRLSTTALYKLNNTWIRKNKIRECPANILQNYGQTSAYVQQPNLGPNSEWWT